MYAVLDCHLRKSKTLSFGGLGIILLGDYYQLPPVQGSHPYVNPVSEKLRVFAGLFYVALGRVRELRGLYLILIEVTSGMCTKWRQGIKKIVNEHNRLRKLPKWNTLLHHTPAAMDEGDSDTPLSDVEDGALLCEMEIEGP